MKRWVDFKDRWRTGQPVVCNSRVWSGSPGYGGCQYSVPAGSRGQIVTTFENTKAYNEDGDEAVIGRVAVVSFTTDDGYMFETNINVNALTRLPRR